MALTTWATGDLISATRLNEVINLLNGTSATNTVTLTSNAAGAFTMQPASAPALSTQLVKINHQDATNVFAIRADGGTIITQYVNTSGSPTALTVTGGAHTTLAASTEAIGVNINLSATVQFATGAITTQRAVVIQAPTYGFVGASTITKAATLAVTAAPTAGTNATITNAYALWVQAGTTQLDGGLTATAGATVSGGSLTVSNATGIVVTQGTITTATLGYSQTATWNSGGTAFTAFKVNTTVTNAAVGSLFVDIQNGGSSVFSIAPLGDVVIAGVSATLTVNGTSTLSGTATFGAGIQASSSTALDITAKAASTWQTQSGNLSIAAASGVISLTPTTTVASGTSATWDGVSLPAATLTVTGSTAITTAGGVNLLTITAPTITDSSSVTITNSGTVVITGAPTAGGSVTITNAYALWVRAGAVRFQGVNMALGTTIDTGIGLKIGGTVTARAASATGTAVQIGNTITQVQDNDTSYGLLITPTFSNGGFAAGAKYALFVGGSGSSMESVGLCNIGAATTDTTGFFWIPSVNGAQTGVPAFSATGAVPLRYDTANNKLWVYSGGAWHFAQLT